MATIFKGRDRNVLPRWRDFRSTIALGELEHPALRRASGFRTPELSELHADWDENRSLAFAGDLLSASTFVNDKRLATDAAQFVLSREAELGPTNPLLTIARSALSPVNDTLCIDLPLTMPAAIGEHIGIAR